MKDEFYENISNYIDKLENDISKMSCKTIEEYDKILIVSHIRMELLSLKIAYDVKRGKNNAN